MVVNHERHIVLGRPFHEGVENQEQGVVVELEFGIGACDECVTVCGIEVKINRQAEALESVVGKNLDITFAQFKGLELAIGVFEPVGEVDALVEVLHGLFHSFLYGSRSDTLSGNIVSYGLGIAGGMEYGSLHFKFTSELICI